jgi:hypothetical protein
MRPAAPRTAILISPIVCGAPRCVRHAVMIGRVTAKLCSAVVGRRAAGHKSGDGCVLLDLSWGPMEMTGQAVRIFGKVLVAVLSAILGAAGLVLAPAAIAGSVESAYTPLVLEKCDNITPSEMAEHGAIFRCTGFGGTDVRVAEGDLRMFVSYGKRAADQTAAGQTLPAFNSTGDRLEWRFKDGKGVRDDPAVPLGRRRCQGLDPGRHQAR